MTNHLPECPHANSRTATFYGGYCVCPLLRACEQRMLDAAREDVLNAPRYGCTESGEPLMELREVLAAIDELRDES